MRVGHDLGVYDNPADYFGRLTFDLWRAVRLVVDTGIHRNGRSYDEAVTCMSAYSFLPHDVVLSEIDRYIGMPAQALSYKRGDQPFDVAPAPRVFSERRCRLPHIQQGYVVPRKINLRQIEAFKAVIESGTISQAADIMNISQPGMSKIIAHLEVDTQLQLFDRSKGRLAPTEQGMRLYREIEQIFAGVRQVENALEVIHREEQGQLTIGVMPALSGDFVQRATMNFLAARPQVYCSVQSLGSQWIVDRIAARKLDIGLIDSGIEHPYLVTEPIMNHPLVCIMPMGHALAKKRRIKPQDLDGVPFLTPNPDISFGNGIQRMFEAHDVKPKSVVVSNSLQTMCGFVAAGLGVSLVHPLVVSGMEDRITARRFEPEMQHHFVMCRSADNRNARLVDEFAEGIRSVAARASLAMLNDI